MASALLVLGASLLAGRLGRARDLALLRAVGASDRLLHWSLVWEFLVLGGGSAALAAAQAWLAARLYGRHVLDLDARERAEQHAAERPHVRGGKLQTRVVVRLEQVANVPRLRAGVFGGFVEPEAEPERCGVRRGDGRAPLANLRGEL